MCSALCPWFDNLGFCLLIICSLLKTLQNDLTLETCSVCSTFCGSKVAQDIKMFPEIFSVLSIGLRKSSYNTRKHHVFGCGHRKWDLSVSWSCLIKQYYWHLFPVSLALLYQNLILVVQCCPRLLEISSTISSQCPRAQQVCVHLWRDTTICSKGHIV